MRTKTSLSFVLGSLALSLAVGCTPTDGSDDYDPALLAEYRTALPDAERLMAAAPEASVMNLVGDPALYPNASYDIIVGINGAVTGVVQLLDTIGSVEPTLYNSATGEFFWGPWENDDGAGYVAAYIREAAPGSDFRFEYAFMRGTDNDLANMRPIVWGAASPDPNNDDHGVGLTVWDFEADYQFEVDFGNGGANNDRGRFATLWAQGPDENEPEATVSIIVAVFRDFVPQDSPGAEPADLDYLFGRFAMDGQAIDFIDWEADMDVSEPVDGLAESVGVRMVFLNEGAGRAEADATGGSLAVGDSWNGVECWDNAIDRTYLNFEVTGSQPASYTEGELVGCDLFQATLAESNVPSLQDLPAEIYNGLIELAEGGL